jgi:hypothetical protein
MSRLFILSHAEARRRAAQHCMEAPDGHLAKFSEPRKSRDQEAKYRAPSSGRRHQVERRKHEARAGVGFQDRHEG